MNVDGVATATCGDFGGVGRSGKPCGRRAGHGTDHKGDGPCWDHGPEGDAALQVKKAAFLAEYGKGTVSLNMAAMRAAGVDPATIYRWRLDDPEFDRVCEDVKLQSLATRLALVEDSTFQQIIKGAAAATLQIFWMTNVARRLGRRTDWMHVSHFRHGADEDNPLTPVFVLPEMLGAEEWQQRFTRPEEAA